MDWPSFNNPASRSSHFPLFALPAELRALIFTYALTSTKPLVAFRLDNYQRDSYAEATQPALTRVNRQLRIETLPIFYACNDIALHTEDFKAGDTRCWLHCVESYLQDLKQVSVWTRYVTLTNDRGSSNGVIAVAMKKEKKDNGWIVDGQWKWVTVTRKPAALDGDVKFLVKTLRELVQMEDQMMTTAQGLHGTITSLTSRYVKEKMS